MLCLIEFVGLPGTGKTTLASGVREALQKAGVHCAYPKEAGAAVVSTVTVAAGNIPFLFRMFRFAAKNRRKAVSKRVLATWLYVAKENRRLRDSGRETNLLLIRDQGFLQDLLSIAHDRPIKWLGNLSALLKDAYGSYDCMVVIHTLLSHEDNIVRLRRRNSELSRADRMESPALRKLLACQEKNADAVLQKIPYHIIEVHTEKSGSEALSISVAEQIIRIVEDAQ